MFSRSSAARALCACVLMAVSHAASAQVQVPEQDMSLSEYGERIALGRARQTLLDLEAKNAVKRLELLKTAREISELQGGGSTARTVAMPWLRAIEGVGKQLYAVIALDDGSVVDAVKGTALPNGMRVVDVQPKYATMAVPGRGRVTLAVASHAPVTIVGAAQPALASNAPVPSFPFSTAPSVKPETGARR